MFEENLEALTDQSSFEDAAPVFGPALEVKHCQESRVTKLYSQNYLTYLENTYPNDSTLVQNEYRLFWTKVYTGMKADKVPSAYTSYVKTENGKFWTGTKIENYENETFQDCQSIDITKFE